MRGLPLEHGALKAAVETGQFPSERFWMDYKLGLYPADPTRPASPPTRGERVKAHRELARDAASMAIRGGYLIYGVHEDRRNFRFEPVGMPLEPGVRETVVQAVAALTSPSLDVRTHVLPDPNQSSSGFLVVEIAESPEAPHMVEGVFHGRSDTGRTILGEPEVERLILQRRRLADRLIEQMALTARHDPGIENRGAAPRAYVTAVPSRGWRDILRTFTQVQTTRSALEPLCAQAMDAVDRPDYSSYGELHVADFVRRGQRIGGIWHRTWDETHVPNGAAFRALGISDDGEVRFQRFQSGVSLTSDQARELVSQYGGPLHDGALSAVLYESDLLRHVEAVLRLVGILAREVGYAGSWMLGLEVHGLDRCVSERNLDRPREVAYRIQVLDSDQYRQTTRASSEELQSDPAVAVSYLTRPLLRSLDRESLLSVPVTA